jgi:hypothetical protein
MDTNAVVINIRMSLFGWGLEQVKGKSDVWLTVHRNSVCKRKTS